MLCLPGMRVHQRVLVRRAKETAIAMGLLLFCVLLMLGFFVIGYRFVYGVWPS